MTDELRYTQERAHRPGQAALWDRGKARAGLSRPAFRTRSAVRPGKPVPSGGLTFLVCKMGNSYPTVLCLTFYKSNTKRL